MRVVVRGDDLQSIDRERGIRSNPLQPSATLCSWDVHRTYPTTRLDGAQSLTLPLDSPGGTTAGQTLLVLGRRDLTCHPALCLLH